MKKLRIVILGALLGGFGWAQQPTTTPSSDATPQTQPAAPQTTSQPPQSPAMNAAGAETPRIAPGSVIPVQITKGVDAKKAKTGDEIDARVTTDLKTNSGEIILPKDTKVVGHVTEAQARTKEQKGSQVAISFDHAVMKDGHNVPLPMSIQAIISPQALTPNPSNNDAGAGQSPAPDSGGAPSGGSGHNAGSGAGMSQSRPPSAPTTGNDSTSSSGNSRPTITANTQGVLGISGMKLAAAEEANQGSVVSSEKNNVKLEDGTLMLLRVNH
jgi:hypothetical protein